MTLTFPPQLYALIFAAVLVVYFIINRMLIGRINRISPAEILKNRE
jgi:putative ABC transport system permease protein